MRFFYYYPTYDKPSGGNKQLRIQAILLRELGVETFLLRDAAFFTRPDSFDDNYFYNVFVPTASFPFERASRHLDPQDIVMLPEVVLEPALAICGAWNVRLAVNNQNGFYGLRYAPPARVVRGRIEFVIANAAFVAGLCQHFYGVSSKRIFHVPYWVVRPPFDLLEEIFPRQLGVCYMPRKLPQLGNLIRDTAQRMRPDVPWIEIDGVPERVVGELLRAHHVFFAAQDLEGFGLPALEAMACGSVVAGFPGTGRFTHPYASPENGFWAPDRDIVAASACVVKAIDLARSGGTAYEALRAEGRQTACRFSKEAALAALRELAQVISAHSYQARPARDWRLTIGEKFYAYKLLYDYSRLGWPGQVAGWLGNATRPVRRLFYFRNG